MRIDILTLFPDMLSTVLETSIMGRAAKTSHVEYHLINFRDHSLDKHQKVDDTPYGGGAGMVLQVEPIVRAIRSIPGYEKAQKILLSPQGQPYHQAKAKSLSHKDHLILICGHYEGFDERLLAYVDEEISLGDYILNGGEVAAWAIVESVVRLRPGVLHNEASLHEESHEDGLIEYPQYTKPPEFEGQSVPDVLISGHHGKIDAWRKAKRIEQTKKKRPDLYEKWVKKDA